MPRPPRLINAQPRKGTRVGRPPKPTALHRIEGTFRADQHAARVDAEPHAPGDLRDKPPPDWLTPSQRELWTETLLDAPANVLRRIDWGLFANYIEILERHAQLVRAQQQLDRGKPLPYLMKTKGGFVLSPYVRAINHCSLIMVRLQTELGFTPVARARFQYRDPEPAVAPPNSSGWDSFARLRVVKGGKD